jgi:hypothetical protein
MSASQLAEIKAKTELSNDEKCIVHESLTALDGAVVPMVVQEAEHGGIARTAAVACGRWCLRPVARGACVPADPSTDCPTTRSTVP